MRLSRVLKYPLIVCCFALLAGGPCFGSGHGTAGAVSTIADLRAVAGEGALDGTIVLVGGYTSSNDGGEGTFIFEAASAATDNDGTIIAPSGGGGRWVRQFSGDVNVRWFGAFGNGSHDDTKAIQAAVNFAKGHQFNVYFPPGNYAVTSSIDCGFVSNPGANFWLIGAGNRLAVISATLTEPYPILDFSGDTRGGIRNLGVIANRGLATCCVYSAKPPLGSNLGNVFGVVGCCLQLFSASTGPATSTALVMYNTDLSYCRDSEIYGPTGATAGGGKSPAITSEFYATPARFDSTLIKFDNVTLNAWAGPALEYTGGAAINVTNCYLAEIGNGSDAIFKVSGAGGKNVTMIGTRMENQSSYTGLAACRYVGESTAGIIQGNLEVGADDYVLDTSASGGFGGYDIEVLSAKGTLFGPKSVASSVRILSNTPRFGTLAPGSSNISYTGAANEASVLSQVAHGATVYKNNYMYRSGGDVFVVPKARNIYGRFLGTIETKRYGVPTSYAGGSGEALVASVTIPGGTLSQWFTSVTTRVALDVELVGKSVAANTKGRLRIVLVQGGASKGICDVDPLNGALTWKARAVLMQVSGNSALNVYSEILGGAGLLGKLSCEDTFAFDLGSDMQIQVYITSNANNGITFQNSYMRYQ